MCIHNSTDPTSGISAIANPSIPLLKPPISTIALSQYNFKLGHRMAAADASLFCSFLVFIFLIIVTMTSAGSVPPASSPNPDSDAVDNSTDFIRASCRSTLYPDLCFASLAPYAPAVHHNPVRLARIAAKLTFSQLHSTTAHVSSYLRGPSTGPEAAALGDCLDSLSNAADQTRRSASEIGKLDRGVAVGPEVAWRVSNAQTWMSAALTNEETCTDGFEKVQADRVKADVFGRVGRAKQYTSNTLALVNCLVNGR